MPYTNTASVAQLASNITSSAVGATLSSFTGWPGEYPFYGIFNRGAGSAELVLVTAAVGNTVTLTRGQGGTLPSSHNAGETFEHVAPADVFNSFETHMASATGVHGVSGAVAGTTGAQTIQDKEYRGHYTHAYADALPAGSAAAFEVAASTAVARDGFKVSNTGADSARRAFVLEQSGTPRHEVFQDGTVKVSPNSEAARPGHEVNAPADKTAVRVTNADAADATTFNVTGDGDTTVGGTLGVAGASTLAGVSASSLSVSGNTTLTGPVSAVGTLAVTGDTTLSGAVSAGSTVTATGTLRQYGNSIPVMSTVTALPAGVANQIVHLSTDNLLYRHNGTAWWPFAYASVQAGHARYSQSAPQSIPAWTVTKAVFNTTHRSTDDVSNSGGHTFTFNRSGLFFIEANFSWGNGTANSFRALHISNGTNTARYGDVGSNNHLDLGLQQAVSTMRWFNSGDTVSIHVYHEAAGPLSSAPFGEDTHVTFTWLRG